jgi:hypothetical protein
MDLSFIYQPVVTASMVAAIFAGTIVFTTWKNRVIIAKALGTLWKKLFTRTGFFWTVNIIFMAVSVLHAGVFFGITGNSHDVPGIASYLGFAVSFFLDLVTIILMQALLEAKYRSDEQRARQFLLFIAICCGTSTFANLAISLNDFDPNVFLPHAPHWVQVASPYVLASFPLFVIMMSIAAEMIINLRPLESLNEDEYEADEKKRIAILKIRNDYLQKQADEELRTLKIHNQMKINSQLKRGKVFRWPWQKAVNVEELLANLGTVYEPQIAELNQRLEELQIQQKNVTSIKPSGTKTQVLSSTKRASASSAKVESMARASETKIAPATKPITEPLDGKNETEEEIETDPEMEPVNVTQIHQVGTSVKAKGSVKRKLNNGQLLTIADAASALQCTPRNVRKLRERGAITVDASGLIVASSVEEYAAKRRKAN